MGVSEQSRSEVTSSTSCHARAGRRNRTDETTGSEEGQDCKKVRGVEGVGKGEKWREGTQVGKGLMEGREHKGRKAGRGAVGKSDLEKEQMVQGNRR